MFGLSRLQAQGTTTGANQLSQSFLAAFSTENEANVYAAAVRDFISRVDSEYEAVAQDSISTGLGCADWTEEKKKFLGVLLVACETILESKTGSEAKNKLKEILQKSESDLALKRTEFSQITATTVPEKGRMENIYIEAIKTAIDMIYDVYDIFGIVDQKKCTIRDIPGSAFVESAVKNYLTVLLVSLDPTSLKKKKELLDDIISVCKKEIADLRVAPFNQSNNQQNPPYDPKLYEIYKINGIFSCKIEQSKKISLEHAKNNVVRQAREAVSFGVTTTSSAINVAINIFTGIASVWNAGHAVTQGSGAHQASSNASPVQNPLIVLAPVIQQQQTQQQQTQQTQQQQPPQPTQTQEQEQEKEKEKDLTTVPSQKTSSTKKNKTH